MNKAGFMKDALILLSSHWYRAACLAVCTR